MFFFFVLVTLKDKVSVLRDETQRKPAARGSSCLQLEGKYMHVNGTCSLSSFGSRSINLLKPTDYVMHEEFNIQQLYVLPTLYLCVLYLSQNK